MTVVVSLPAANAPEKRVGQPAAEQEEFPGSADMLAAIMRSAQCDAATATEMLRAFHREKAEGDRIQKMGGRKGDRSIRTSPDFFEWMEARRVKVMMGSGSDCHGDYYSCLADDAAQNPRKREAAVLLSAAEEQLESGQADEALASAKQAGEIYAGLGDTAGEADAARMAVHAYRLQAELARWNPIEYGGEDLALMSTKKARELAGPKLQSCREQGDRRGAAMMLLCLAEVDVDAAKCPSAIPEAALQGATEACALLREVQDRRMEAAALLTLSRIQGRKNRPADARRSAEDALSLYRVLGGKKTEAAALHALAVALALDHDVPAGLQAARDALDAAREARDSRAAALELIAIASFSLDLERPSDAIPAAQEAADACRALGQAFGVCAVAEQILVEAHVMRDAADKAVELASAGVQRCQEAGDKREEVCALVTLAHARTCAGDAGQATAAYDEALALCQELEDGSWAALVRLTLAQALLAAGDAAGAEQTLQEAEAWFAQDGDSLHEAVAVTLMSSLLLERGDYDRARQAAERGQELFREEHDTAQELVAQLQAAACSFLKGDMAGALAEIEDVVEASREVGFGRGEIAALSLAIDVHRASGDADRALQAARDMRKAAQEAGSRKLETNALYHIARLHIDRGQGEAKLAAKAADAAGKGAQKLGHRTDQVYMLILAAEARLEVIKELSDGAGGERALKDSASRCVQNIADAVALAQRTGRSDLQALASYFEGVVLLALRDNDGAVAASQRARVLFQESSDQSGEASSLLILAQARNELKEGREAAEAAAKEARDIFKQCQDKAGEARAEKLLDTLAPQMPALPGGMMMPPWAMMGAGGGKRKVKKMVKKEKKGLSSAMVAQTVLSLAKESINLDNLELFDDSALMDSGMDSLTAVSFRNSVQSALNLKMPASLMFDYPTIKEITSHIVEIGGGDGGGDEWEEIEVEEDDGMPDMQMMWAMMQGQGGGGGKRTIKKRVKKEKKGLSSAMVAQTVLSLAKESINLDNLELFDDSALMDSGMDSLTAVSFRNSVQSALNLKMPASLMFDYPTIKEITSHIVEIGGGDGGGESEYEEIDVEVDDGMGGMGMMPPPEWFMAQQGGMPAAAASGEPAAAQEKAKPKGLDASMVMQTVRDMALQAIQLDDQKLDEDSPLMDSGMDSLTSVSFRNSLQSALGMKVPASLMFDYPTMKEITGKIVELSLEK